MIPRLRSPGISDRFPEMFEDRRKDKTSFLYIFMENRFLPFSPVAFPRKPEPVPRIQVLSLFLHSYSSIMLEFAHVFGWFKPSCSFVQAFAWPLILVVWNSTDVWIFVYLCRLSCCSMQMWCDWQSTNRWRDQRYVACWKGATEKLARHAGTASLSTKNFHCFGPAPGEASVSSGWTFPQK